MEARNEDSETRELEALLQQALKAEPPEGLSERIDAITARLLPDAQSRELEADLRRVLAGSVPQGLNDRIFAVTCQKIDEAALQPVESQLRDAFSAAAPAGLTGRIYSATAHRLDCQPVLATLGSSGVSWYRRSLVAAVVALAAGAAVWMSIQDRREDTAVKELLAALEERSHPVQTGSMVDPFEGRIMILRRELESAELQLQDDRLDDLVADRAESLRHEVDRLEADLESLLTNL